MSTNDAYLSTDRLTSLGRILPYWSPVLVAPLPLLGAYLGGIWVLLPVLATWVLFSCIDTAVGLDLENADPQTDRRKIRAYQGVTLVWAPLQALSLFATLAYVPAASHLGGWELAGLAFGLGVMGGTIGINFSHELMHVGRRTERWLSDALLGMVMYSHFRSEHMLVHHRYVCTPRDPVTARYGENFHRYFPRVVAQCLAYAFRAEAALQARRGRRRWHGSHPFWRHWMLQAHGLSLAFCLAGWVGAVLFLSQL